MNPLTCLTQKSQSQRRNRDLRTICLCAVQGRPFAFTSSPEPNVLCHSGEQYPTLNIVCLFIFLHGSHSPRSPSPVTCDIVDSSHPTFNIVCLFVFIIFIIIIIIITITIIIIIIIICMVHTHLVS